MRIAYFDLYAGASGDMILAALLDAGVPLDALRAALDALALPGFRLEARRVQKHALGATLAEVVVEDTATERHLADIEALVAAAPLPPGVTAAALGIFRRLGEVEAHIPGEPVERVHLHEVGGLDTIVDVVGALLALRLLGVEAVYVSPFPVAQGTVQAAHGALPLPAPATLALLRGAPVRGVDIRSELVTPTGAAILTGLAAGYGPCPPMTLHAVGYGAGRRDLPFPNLLRVWIGETAESAAPSRRSETLNAVPWRTDTLTVLETNLDDQSPQVLGHVMAKLLEAGALDVYFTSIQMKKNRPGTLLAVLCDPPRAAALAQLIFAETSTLGVRRRETEVWRLKRGFTTVETAYGPVRVKVAQLGGGEVKAAPEFDDCRAAAERTGAPLREVYQAALAALPAAGEAEEWHFH